MKKIVALLLSVTLLIALAGCGTDETGTTQPPAEGSDLQASAEVLEILGMTAEEFAALEPDVRQALLDEVGAVLENDRNDQDTEKEPVTYTPDDVMAGGSYVVVLGDYMNSITLYYENGVLVKLVEDFQKSFDEETSSVTYEGEALEEYGFNFIDWSGATLQEILDGMADYGGYDEYQIRKAD